MRILVFHGYLLRGTGSNIYNANLARTLAGLGHEVDLFCQDRTVHEPEGVTIHVPDIGRLLPVYVADRYEGFDALPFPELDEAAGAPCVHLPPDSCCPVGTAPENTTTVRNRPQ